MAISFLQNNQDSATEALQKMQLAESEKEATPREQDYEYTDLTPEPVEHPENEHFLEEPSTSEDQETEAPLSGAKVHTTSAKPAHPQKAIPQVRDETIVQIEKILEEDLADVYTALTPLQKQQFKIKGEETALKIQRLLRNNKIRLGKIVKLIFEWLKMLPGINRFFLEQESKIKAEKIAFLHQQKKFQT